MKGVATGQVGTVLAEGLMKVDGIRGNRIIEEDIWQLKAAWQKPLDF